MKKPRKAPPGIEPLFGDVRWPIHEWQKGMAECADVPRPTIENADALIEFLVDKVGISKWQENSLKGDILHLLRNTKPEDRWKLNLAMTTGMRIQSIIDRKGLPQPKGGSVGSRVRDIVRRLHQQFPDERPTFIIRKARREAGLGPENKPTFRNMQKSYARMVSQKMPSSTVEGGKK